MLLWYSTRLQLQSLFIEKSGETLAFETSRAVNLLRRQIEEPLPYLNIIRNNWSVEQFVQLNSPNSDQELHHSIQQTVTQLFQDYVRHIETITQVRLLGVENQTDLISVAREGENIYLYPTDSRIDHTPTETSDFQTVLALFEQQQADCGCSTIHTLSVVSDDNSAGTNLVQQLMVPVYDKQQLVAIVVAQHNLGAALEQLADTLPWPEASITLFREGGETIFHVGQEPTLPLAQTLAREGQPQQQIVLHDDSIGALHHFSIGPSHSGHPMSLYIEVGHRQLFPAQYNDKLRYATGISLLVFIGGIVLALIAATTLCHPIQLLKRTMSHYNNESFDERALEKPFFIKEIELLRAAFLQLHRKIKQEFTQRTTLEKRLQQQVAERTSALEQRHTELLQEIEKHHQTQNQLQLVREVMQNSRQAVVITDKENTIIEVNQAYITLTGFSREQVIGAKPSIGKSEQQSDEFYQQMWQQLNRDNHWEGEIWDRRANGEIYPKYLYIDRLLNQEGEVVNYVAMFEDLTHQKSTERELEYLTHYDQLTGLTNRTLFRHRLEHEFEVSRRHNCSTALVLVNLDRFRQVNENFGYLIGDKVLKSVAKQLEQIVRKTDLIARDNNAKGRKADTVARFSGDEFSIILSELKQPENAAIVARRMVASITKPMEIDGFSLHLSASLGIATYPDNATTHAGLLLCAEQAMGRAKAEGGNTIQFYSEAMNINSSRRFFLETALHQAIEKREFVLYYQPKVDLISLRIIGMEALIRWQKEDGSIVSPQEFIPLAEESGLILPIGEWVLQQACEDAYQLAKQFDYPFGMAVNLSPRQFRDADILALVERALQQSDLPAERLELEITETAIMSDTNYTITMMQQLVERGISLSIDDFGTGYSSLAYLKKFPVNTLKIDRTFVADLEQNNNDAAIVSAICSMAHQLDLKLVAEGIETPAQRDFLRQSQCHYGQGYLFSRPLPLASLQKRLNETDSAAAFR